LSSINPKEKKIVGTGEKESESSEKRQNARGGYKIRSLAALFQEGSGKEGSKAKSKKLGVNPV